MLKKKTWIKENQKYIKGALIATVVLCCFLFFFLLKLPKEKIKEDKNKQTYREITHGEKVIQIPVFENKKLNQEIKKYEKNVLQDKNIDKVTYEVKKVGDVTQIIFKEMKEGKKYFRYWHYQQKMEKALTMNDFFGTWNPNIDSKIKKLSMLEYERNIRLLTPPIPKLLSVEELNQRIDFAIRKNQFYLVDNENESNLYLDISQKGESNLIVGIPLYLLKDDIHLEALGLKKEVFDRWFSNQNKNRKLVAFTYDDGPNPMTTPVLLQELTKRGANATFYMLGRNIERNPDVVKMIQNGGFEMGSHTYNHKNLKRLTEEEQAFEINGTVDALKKITGVEPSSTRPPYGNYNDATLSLLKNPILLWSVDTLDWKYRNTNAIIEHAINQIDDGDIVLFHDIYQTSVDASLNMIDELYKRGYLVMSVSELVRAKQITLQPGMKYYHIG